MPSPQPKRRVARTPLSRERVVAAAMVVADEHGSDALTMRRLGQELGVEAMSLYNHVANKEDLLSALLDAVVSEYTLPAPDAEWKPALRASAMSAHQVLLRHPWAPGLLLTFRSMPGPGWMRYSEAVLATLRRAGFSPEMTHHAFHALEGHIDGYTLRQVNFPLQPEELEGAAKEFLERFPAADHPYLIEHIRGHLRKEFRGKGGFEFGLDLILDGLEQLPRSG
jgi:AcrR family transcriptional regulator